MCLASRTIRINLLLRQFRFAMPVGRQSKLINCRFLGKFVKGLAQGMHRTPDRRFILNDLSRIPCGAPIDSIIKLANSDSKHSCGGSNTAITSINIVPVHPAAMTQAPMEKNTKGEFDEALCREASIDAGVLELYKK